MSEPTKEKGEEKGRDFKKTREYRNFKKLLKQVIKSPPMKRQGKPA